MISRRKSSRGWRLWLMAGVLATVARASHQSESATTAPLVSVIHASAATLSAADAAREGAAEFVVLLEIARVNACPAKGGLVGVGNRRGLFSADTEEALRRAVLQGIPVVKLAPRGEVIPAPHGLFLDGGTLSEDEASRVLAQCLTTHGALPAVRGEPSSRELAAIQKQLKLFQQQLTVAASARLAAR